ncbi:translation initiation factor IF-2 [Leuconostoc gelidum]|uniref:Translation initiation factor IF-2 n=1 Tax=Leuconostoc gelidum subsp. gelidum TaxID=1607839 RepID=A0ABS7V2V9_LEUGE|nr:translation initiation factor IF-2 [Leuconostoc gelidum]AFS40219.1 translation initiation factor IF-2 [Leuconostoc gelidum JB7]MBZ5964271.1 translation initiation factor IF-2 [Leuconostoc gelidum subsp. gelidum]MBZ5975130.1 translation initiation factor IF-2 [Leuconostoc gelidum subsp. gelidum]MBZ5976920.1 translation initiation factor IF-2 [Leuconostoc gelidum subsp. gelidum]MBZ5986877.1 translation initiation factor IF-2 [Leuconostoc gelidum subsp. gelidum]
MTEEKKFSGSNRPARKQAVPERKELPASQRRHAAKLTDGTTVTPNNTASRPSKPVRSGQGQQNRTSNQNRTNSTATGTSAAGNRSNNGGQNQNRNGRPGSRVRAAEGRPAMRETKNWSTKPREGQVDYSKQKDNSLKQYVSENEKRKQAVAAAKEPQKPKPAVKPAENKKAEPKVVKPTTAAPTTGAGKFGGALASGNNSARNNSRKRNTAGTGQQTPRRNDKPRGSKKSRRIAAKRGPVAPVTERKKQPLPEILEYRIGMNVQDLSKLLHRDTAEIIKKLFLLGIMTNQNQSLDTDTIEILAADYGIEAQVKAAEDVADIDRFFDDENIDEGQLVSRPPVVTIMGHVDHGKTTLLDYLRNSHVTEGEAGGITQHIGAYQTQLNGKTITFLDTPGHAAFTEMRARGANVTDLTILVVAADDGVMPQTIEAINHAKAANTPIIVAVNKIDKPGAKPDDVMNQLMAYDLVPEEYGGDTIFVKISAKFGQNVDELLEMILLQAEVLELKANPDMPARGSVVEARLDRGRGPVATVLVQQGTMRVGDPIVVGNTYGRVRTMTNERGVELEEASPATPVQVTGLNDVPQAGDRFIVMADEKTARAAGEERAKRAQEVIRNSGAVVTLDTLFSTMSEKAMKTVPVIVKADVQGSVEALSGSLKKIEVDGVRVDIIHTAAGAINESDVTLASASGAIIIGFNVRPTPLAKSQADSEKVDIRFYNVIYNAIDDVEAAMKGQLEPVYEEKIIGTVTVKELFKFSKVGIIAGAMVEEGKITKEAKVRVIRDGVVAFDGDIASLQRGKDSVNEVKMGFEFGFTVAKYNDVRVGDVVEAYVMAEVKAK